MDRRFVSSSRFTVLHLAAAAPLAAAALLAGCFNVTAPTGSRDECTNSGGLCVPTGDCVPAGGTVSTPCYLEGVETTECCMGPTPTKPTATTCADQGGLCVPLGACAAGRGYVSIVDFDCGQAEATCCLPRALCGEPSFQCCSNSFLLDEPRCDNGTIVCGPLDQKVDFFSATCERQ